MLYTHPSPNLHGIHSLIWYEIHSSSFICSFVCLSEILCRILYILQSMHASELIHTNRSKLIVVSNKTAWNILSPRSIWYDQIICSVQRWLVASIILFYRFQGRGEFVVRFLSWDSLRFGALLRPRHRNLRLYPIDWLPNTSGSWS